MSDKCFKPLFGFCTELDERLDKDDIGMSIPDKYRAKLCQELNSQYYTYLVVCDSLCHEIVCVELIEGMLMITRAIDDTYRQYWACGTKVKYEGSVPSAIWDIKQAQIELPEPDCEPQSFTGEIRNGNCTVHFKEGVAIKETVNKHQIRDGCYDEPVPTYEEGHLVDLAEGANYAMVPQGCCG